MKIKKPYYLSPVFFRLLLLSLFSLLMLILLLLGGCSNELSAPETPDGGEVAQTPGMLTLRVNIPGVSATSGEPQSRALEIQDECIVSRENLHVLLFSNDTGTADAETDASFTYAACLTPEEKDWGTGSTTNDGSFVQTFRISLDGYGDNARLKAVVLGNITPVQMQAYDALLQGHTLADMPALLRFEQPDGTIWNTTRPGFTPLPLWGQTRNAFTPQAATVGSITLLRAVARIDVGVNLIGGDGNGRYDLATIDGRPMDLDGHTFEIKSVTLYNAARSGTLAPAPARYDAQNNTVATPSIDTSTAYHTTTPRYTYSADTPGAATNMLRRQIYLPETGNHGTDDNEHTFYIVVGGSYNGGPESYYRIEFYDRTDPVTGKPVKPSAENRYDILRNYAYVVNILRVRGAGYATADIAAASESVNMEIEIRSWDTGENMTNIVTDGQYRLALGTSRLNYHTDGTAQELAVFTDYLLPGNSEASGWRMEPADPAQAALLRFYDAAGNPVPVENWEAAGVTRGIANATATLRVGLAPYTGDDGKMERTVPLRFTAGRMSTSLDLVQDVLTTVTMDVSPASLSFTRNPQAPLFVTMKLSPAAGYTLYACWDENGAIRKYNITDPTVPENQGNPPPPAFHDDADDAGHAFFVRVPGDTEMYSLYPTKWDAAANAGIEPTTPRIFRFTILAEWADGRTVSKLWEVKQSNSQMSWELWDRQGGSKIEDKTLHFTGAGGEQTPYVNASEGMPWYFPSYTETGNYTGAQWLTNWQALTAATYTGSSVLTFNVTPNPSIASRRMTIQASSDQEGFDRNANRIIIDQQGGDLVLEPDRGTGTEAGNLTYDPATRTYLLDYGIAMNPMFKGVTLRANTDWWWNWTPGGATTTDPPYNYRLASTHPYFKKWLVGEMTPKESGKEHTTTGNSDDQSILKSWNDAFTVQTPVGYFLSPNATTDDDLRTKGFPLAGEYYTEVQIYNTHNRLNADDPGDAARIEAASKKLRIHRTIPALWFASTLPFAGRDYVNLGNFTGADVNRWDTQKLVFSGNTPVTMTVKREGVVKATQTLTPVATYETKTVESVLTTAVDPADVSFAKPKVTYTLTLSGRRQMRRDQPDRENYSITRTYYTGYRMEMPKMENCEKGALLSNNAVNTDDILFNFSGSTYPANQRVRIVRQGYDPEGSIIPEDVLYTEYNLDGSKFQRYIKYTVPENRSGAKMYAYYIQYIPYGGEEWTGVFADGVSSSPAAGQFCFVQDARSIYNHGTNIVFAKQTTTLEQFPNGEDISFGDDPSHSAEPWIQNGKIKVTWNIGSRTCPLTGRKFFALAPGSGSEKYYSGRDDNRGWSYGDSYRSIYYPARGNALADIKVDLEGVCNIGNTEYTERKKWFVYDNKQDPDLQVWRQWKSNQFYPGSGYGTFQGRKCRLYYITGEDSDQHSIDIISVAAPFTDTVSIAPPVSPELYGTKVSP